MHAIVLLGCRRYRKIVKWVFAYIKISVLSISSSVKHVHYKAQIRDLSRYFISGLALRVNESSEYMLRQELLGKMDVMVRPVVKSSDAVNVSFSLTVWTLMDLVCFKRFSSVSMVYYYLQSTK